jgi:NAD(P)-dependent dehydrogenase (short-subunit alcohol dehydrogenase family)
MDLGLSGAAAVVQGGSRGMGRATAECFARDGARVAILGRTQKDLDEAVEHLTAIGSPDALGIQTDITQLDQVEQAFAQIGDRWGALNILVNAAGPSGAGRFETLTDAEWVAAIDTGAMGMVRCIRAALPLLRRAEWARIVNVSAHSTKRQTSSLVAYTAAKSMLTSISKNLSLSLASEEILVNTVSPGSFATPALKGWATSVGIDAEDPYAIMTGIAEHFGHPAHLPRAGLAPEIGSVIAFLASKANSYMTGANVNVDGGSDFT